MSIITFPSFSALSFTSFSFRPSSNTQRFTSPLNKQTQTTELPGTRWIAEGVFEAGSRADQRLMAAFLASLRGSANRFYLWDLSHETPRGVYTGTVAVSGANQSGSSLVTSGWTGTLKAGDYVQFTTDSNSPVVSELRMLIADATGNGANVSLSLDAPMRASPVNGSNVTTSKASAKMLLSDDESAKWGFSGGMLAPFSFTAFEDLG